MALHVIENDQIKVTVADAGAELVSVIDKDSGMERMWNADPAIWNRHAPILFPFVGKVAGGEYRVGNRTYPMKNQHGFARDRVFDLVEKTDRSISHRLTSDAASKEIYPYDFILTVTHELDSGRFLKVIWEVENRGEEPMYYSIGGHPGFQVPADPGKEDRSDYFLEFPGKEKVDYILLNTENGLAVTDKGYSLVLEKGFAPIRRDMFDLDAMIFEGGQIDCVRIAGPDHKPYVSLYCDGFPYVGIWSKPQGSFVCLEPWLGRTDDDGFSGTIEEKTGEQKLAVGQSCTVSYSMEFHEQ